MEDSQFHRNEKVNFRFPGTKTARSRYVEALEESKQRPEKNLAHPAQNIRRGKNESPIRRLFSGRAQNRDRGVANKEESQASTTARPPLSPPRGRPSPLRMNVNDTPPRGRPSPLRGNVNDTPPRGRPSPLRRLPNDYTTRARPSPLRGQKNGTDAANLLQEKDIRMSTSVNRSEQPRTNKPSQENEQGEAMFPDEKDAEFDMHFDASFKKAVEQFERKQAKAQAQAQVRNAANRQQHGMSADEYGFELPDISPRNDANELLLEFDEDFQDDIGYFSEIGGREKNQQQQQHRGQMRHADYSRARDSYAQRGMHGRYDRERHRDFSGIEFPDDTSPFFPTANNYDDGFDATDDDIRESYYREHMRRSRQHPHEAEYNSSHRHAREQYRGGTGHRQHEEIGLDECNHHSRHHGARGPRRGHDTRFKPSTNPRGYPEMDSGGYATTYHKPHHYRTAMRHPENDERPRPTIHRRNSFSSVSTATGTNEPNCYEERPHLSRHYNSARCLRENDTMRLHDKYERAKRDIQEARERVNNLERFLLLQMVHEEEMGMGDESTFTNNTRSTDTWVKNYRHRMRSRFIDTLMSNEENPILGVLEEEM